MIYIRIKAFKGFFAMVVDNLGYGRNCFFEKRITMVTGRD